MRKSTIKTEQELFRQFSIWHQLGIYNISKKWNGWNYNILEFICVLDDFLIFCGICSVSFFWDYHKMRCDIWRNWAGIVSISLAFDTSSEFFILLKNKNYEKALTKLSRNCSDSLEFVTSSAFIILLKKETDKITIFWNLIV